MTLEDSVPITFDDIAAVIRVLATGGYYVPEITDDFVNVWLEELQGFTIPVLRDTAHIWVRSMTKFPTLAHFVEEAQIVTRRMAAVNRPAITSGDRTITPIEEYPNRIAKVREENREIGPIGDAFLRMLEVRNSGHPA